MYNFIKKIISFSLILVFGIAFFNNKNTFANDQEETYFVVTAYYSPLPNQKYYLKGNYEDEKILNGEGIRGASGKEVFSGMLAAPKNYKFGTKIYLEGLGVGVVEDRGGAIVNAGNRGYKNDRIDVWVGYGDEGLRRALYWGKRKVKGKILSSDSVVNLKYEKIKAPLWATAGLKSIPNIFNIGIGVGSDTNVIKKLQEFLSEAGIYSGKIDGKYNNEIIDLIYNIQIKNGLVKSETDYGAGYWGSKTRALILKKYTNGEFDKPQKKLVYEKRKTKLEEKYKKLKSIANKEIENRFQTIGKPKLGEVGLHVRNLQLTLKELGYFNYKDTAIFGEITKAAIIDYQLDKNIIQLKSENGAGVFGPKTRQSIKNDLIKITLLDIVEKEELLTEVKNLNKNKNISSLGIESF